MRIFGIRRLAVAIVAVGLFAAALGVGGALGSGGLAVTPGILEHVARPGEVGTLKVANTTSSPMTVRLAVRPWTQARISRTASAVWPSASSALASERRASQSWGSAAT